MTPQAAVLPGVTVTATSNATGIVRTVLSNEAGAYNFASLMPGVYKVSAQLPGFQTRTYSDVQLGNDQQIRLNFTLSLSSVGTSVDVTVAVDTLLATSSSSVGTVLSEQTVQALPIVGNNIMGLLDTLPGTRMDANGVTGTFNGLFVRSVNVSAGRHGVQRCGAQYASGYDAVHLHESGPDRRNPHDRRARGCRNGARQRTDAGFHAIGHQPV